MNENDGIPKKAWKILFCTSGIFMILVLIGLCLSAGWFSNFSSFYQKKLIGQQTQAEESITFAPGEIKKENKVLIGVLGGIVIILGIIGLIKAGNFIFLIPVFIYFSESLHNGFGMDVWLARAIVVMLVVPFYFSVRMSTSLKKSERAQGIVFLSVMLCLCFFALFMHTGEQFFNHQTGEPIKWYAKTPEGYRFFDSPG